MIARSLRVAALLAGSAIAAAGCASVSECTSASCLELQDEGSAPIDLISPPPDRAGDLDLGAEPTPDLKPLPPDLAAPPPDLIPPPPDLSCGSKTLCGGTCVDIQSTPSHCGRCGHDCLGGGCASGVCRPLQLASGQASPQGIAVGGGYVYWANRRNNPVIKAPTTATRPGQETIAATTTDMNWDVALDSNGNIFTTGGEISGDVYKGSIPFAGDTQPLPRGITTDTSSVFWVNGLWGSYTNAVMKMPLGGGAPTQLAVSPTSASPWGIAVDAVHNQVFWTNESEGTLRRVPVSGSDGSSSTIYASGEPTPRGVATDGSIVYWATATGIRQVLTAYPPLQSPSTFAAALDATDIATDSDSNGDVFWTEQSAVMSASKTSRTPLRLDAGHASSPWGIAIDQQAAYWTNAGDGSVWKVARP